MGRSDREATALAEAQATHDVGMDSGPNAEIYSKGTAPMFPTPLPFRCFLGSRRGWGSGTEGDLR